MCGIVQQNNGTEHQQSIVIFAMKIIVNKKTAATKSCHSFVGKTNSQMGTCSINTKLFQRKYIRLELMSRIFMVALNRLFTYQTFK